MAPPSLSPARHQMCLNSVCVCLRRHPGKLARAASTARPVAHDKNRTLSGGPNVNLYPLEGRVEEKHEVWEVKREIRRKSNSHGGEFYQSSLKPGGGSSGRGLFLVLQG